jgi:putative membrane protein
LSISDLPTLNAFLNASSAVLLGLGFVMIKAGRREAHRRLMTAALATSSLFLVSYLVYHFNVGSVRFSGNGVLRAVYLTILATHTVLAIAIVPLVLVTFARARRGDFSAHRRLARLTLPFWAYVSVTGVVIYWMLYRL